jgi:hypothetical protein
MNAVRLHAVGDTARLSYEQIPPTNPGPVRCSSWPTISGPATAGTTASGRTAARGRRLARPGAARRA